MLFSIVRWAAGILLFVLFLIIFILTTKKKAKSALISAFISIILVAVSLFIPVENVFCTFGSVEEIFSYRYHEELLSYAECDEGALCVAKRDEMNYFYYSFPKDDEGYKLPTGIVSDIVKRSSAQGIYLFESFESHTIILTQVVGSEYKGEAFKPCTNGYYAYIVTDGEVDYSALSCSGEKVRLV